MENRDTSGTITPEGIISYISACGYRPDLLHADFVFGDNQRVPLAAFAQPLADSRSACLAVVTPEGPRTAVERCRSLGAPVIFACVERALQWWKQGPSGAEFLQTVPPQEIASFFREHQQQFSPDAIYRAKTWGRFQTQYQLSFVDVGLLPILEEEIGVAIGRLIERAVSQMKEDLGWDDITSEQGHWLLQTVFWLVSGKILHDKNVGKFKDLDLANFEQVFTRLSEHYGAAPLAAGSAKKTAALISCAEAIANYSSLVLTTTEALAYVYENTLISKKTRSELGTHSTPAYLVDYVVGNLADFIKEIPEERRSVYEPACGHAAFLVSAMRLLTELLPAEKRIPARRGPYLRRRLHGTDVDAFALDLARLSLTLTDIPNPNGWDLQARDMFIGQTLSEQASSNTILLANPPFDNFTPEEQSLYLQKKPDLRFLNKAAEMLWRTVPQLPEGAVFGVVLPQAFLHSKNSQDIREFLLRHCELKEISLFPDRMFSFPMRSRLCC